MCRGRATLSTIKLPPSGWINDLTGLLFPPLLHPIYWWLSLEYTSSSRNRHWLLAVIETVLVRWQGDYTVYILDRFKDNVMAWSAATLGRWIKRRCPTAHNSPWWTFPFFTSSGRLAKRRRRFSLIPSKTYQTIGLLLLIVHRPLFYTFSYHLLHVRYRSPIILTSAIHKLVVGLLVIRLYCRLSCWSDDAKGFATFWLSAYRLVSSYGLVAKASWIGLQRQ